MKNALIKIREEVKALRQEAAEGHRPDEYALALIERKLDAQIEMLDREIAE